MALSPNVVVVAPGDLITAAHLNNVRSNLDRLDTTKLSLTGGTMTGLLTASGQVQLPAATPTAVQAVRKDLLDASLDNKVDVAGDTMTGSLIIGAAPESNTPTPGIALFLSTGAIANCPPGAVAANQANYIMGRGGSPAANTGALYVRLDRGGTQIGSIAIASVSSVAFNTTSDPRTKTPPPLTRGIDTAAARVQAIGRNAWQGHHIDPATGDAEGGDVWDFVSSHDVEDHAPYAVHGGRDDVDPDTGGPTYQQVSYGDLVPLLFAALADALDRIDALELAAA